MKNIFILLVIGLVSAAPSYAQTSYTIEGSSSKLSIIEVNRVTLMGTTDNKVTIEIEGDGTVMPEKAKGLKLINPAGYSDNTGLGLFVEKKDDTHYIRSLSTKAGKRYIIKVPASYFVHYETSSYNGKRLIIDNLKAELDASVSYGGVELSGVTGPMAIHSVFGGITADFESVSQDGPISLYSVYQDVDVSVPSSSKAEFKLKVSYGDLYSDMDLKYPKDEDGMTNLTGKDMGAMLNGGGVSFTIKSGYKNIYLRKK